MSKKRLDILLFERRLAPSRQRAQAIILAGAVMVDGNRVTKAGQQVAEDTVITVKEKDHAFVSRGGVKLAHALDQFNIYPKNKTCLDLGASTGGFTDCLLQRGAKKVWAIDVGSNQLDYRLRTDKRVVSMEGVNAREIDTDVIEDNIDILVADVSFISLKLVVPPLLPVLIDGATLILLVKPQFEAGKENVGKGGIVRDACVQKQVMEDIVSFFTELGLAHLGSCDSPIEGRKGNKEFLIHLKA